jgi:hypothetical protein
MKMRSKRLLVVATITTLVIPLGVAVPGCSEGTQVSLQPAPPVQATPSQPVPKDPKKGGVPGSSGQAKRNPGAST